MTRLAHVTSALSPTLRANVLDFWFQSNTILPGPSDMARWFSRNEEFDRLCVRQFQPGLEVIRDANVTAFELRTALNLTSPLDWLSTLLLLDQVSRNCYRDLQSAVVFSHFDPLAAELALQAIKDGIPESKMLKYRLAYRQWFYMPLMHSECLETHEVALRQWKKVSKDAEDLIQTRDSSLMDADALECYRVLSKEQDAVRGFISSCTTYEERHAALIERFGRYPHRNQPLGRNSTDEEISYLRNGGETFGSKADF